MIEVFCTVKHAPSEGKTGDCIRACVASILEMPTDQVEHFAEGEAGLLNVRLREWLKPLGYAPWWSHFDGAQDRATVLTAIGETMPDCHYVLFGRLASGSPHAVVCRGGEVVHDPSWAPMPMTQCSTLGTWTVLVIAKA